MDGMGTVPLPHAAMDVMDGKICVRRDRHDPERHAANDRHGGPDVRRVAVRVGPGRGILHADREWEGQIMNICTRSER